MCLHLFRLPLWHQIYLLIYSANSYWIANSICMRSTSVNLSPLKCLFHSLVRCLGSSLHWLMTVVSDFHFILCCERRYPQLGLRGLFRKELGTSGQKGCYGSCAWTAKPRNRGENHLLSMSGAGGMRLQLWGRWKLFGTAARGWAVGAEQALKARPAECLGRSHNAQQVWPAAWSGTKGEAGGRGWVVAWWLTWCWHIPALRMWLYREMLRWTAEKVGASECWAIIALLSMAYKTLYLRTAPTMHAPLGHSCVSRTYYSFALSFGLITSYFR